MKIGIDIDEVVADFYGTFLSYYNLRYNKKVCFEDLLEYKANIFGEDREKIDNIFNEFFKSDDFDKIELKEGAFEGISFLDDNFDIVFVTARCCSLKHKTFNFFNKFFPGRNFDIVFIGDDSFNMDKFNICKSLECDLIIEDKGETCLDFAKKGAISILLDKPWNQGIEHSNIYRCFSWSEIVEKVNESGIKDGN